ncbi:hypothetical protein M9H77_09763 [Catharanthus roseus]|uniref:Uncharacterized protein n=1 Tax=Catharanthus roseus TaxID=4058 RepID=A0ACC0C201_CATRO|nr:hypothetical protein M9H77_09763 [Catharanthus roseus]
MATIVNIPDDAIIEILLRLPVKSLIRFKSVSKFWFSLLISPQFIDMHLKFSLARDDELVLIKRFLQEESKNVLSLHSNNESLKILVPNYLDLQDLNIDNDSLEIKAPNEPWSQLVGCILSLDINTEAFHKFGLPKADKTSIFENLINREILVVIHDALALLLYTHRYPTPHPYEQFIDVWIMKEYGNEESWSKQYSIGPLSRIQRPISIWKNNRILLEKVVPEYNLVDDNVVQLVACDLFNCEKLLKYNIIGLAYTLEVLFYKESLVSIA